MLCQRYLIKFVKFQLMFKNKNSTLNSDEQKLPKNENRISLFWKLT